MKLVPLASLATLALPATALVQRSVPAQPPKVQKTQARSASESPAPTTSAPCRRRFVVATTGTEARDRGGGRVVGKDLPNDVIGATKDVSGRLVVEPDGRVLKDSSKIVVKVATLKTDQTRRDNYLRRRTLETDKFPNVELVPTTFSGITSPIPAGESRSFSLTGDLTIHGVTRPTTWQVTARTEGQDYVGKATTAFTFKDFSLEQPRVPIVLGVADTVRLEYDFRFTPSGSK
jgi:polyisoprenoid-binding protein YceI